MHLPSSIPRVCDVELIRGDAAAAHTPPDLLLEVAHGATSARHFDELRAQLRGDYDDGLRDFFFVNTDVGAPEVAMAIARGLVRQQPHRKALVVRCLVPRTFVDCNRRIDPDAVARASKAGEMTPGLQPWVLNAEDRDLLLGRYRAYRDAVTTAFAAVCGNGGLGLCVHTYAPRSIDVPVDERIGANLRAAYAPGRIESWPLRASVDLITHDPEGHELAFPKLAERVIEQLTGRGIDVTRNGTYAMHPVTLAHAFAVRYPAATLCFEIRRDLLLSAFVPFRELLPDATRVESMAAPFVAALTSVIP